MRCVYVCVVGAGCCCKMAFEIILISRGYGVCRQPAHLLSNMA